MISQPKKKRIWKQERNEILFQSFVLILCSCTYKLYARHVILINYMWFGEIFFWRVCDLQELWEGGWIYDILDSVGWDSWSMMLWFLSSFSSASLLKRCFFVFLSTNAKANQSSILINEKCILHLSCLCAQVVYYILSLNFCLHTVWVAIFCLGSPWNTAWAG
jgi:hypothetical protein